MARVIFLLLAALAGCHAAATSVRVRPLICRSALRSARVVACAAPAEEEEPPADVTAASPDDDVAADDVAADDGADGLLSSPAFMKKKIEVLEDEIAKLQAANAELQAKLDEEERSPTALRLQADFENFRRRTNEQAIEQKVYSTIDNVKKLLPVLDNFDRASMLKLESPEAAKIQGSYNQLYKQLLDVLSKEYGCVEVEALGKEFDFNLHTAIVSVSSEDVPENHIVDVLQRGYMIGDKLVRPAGVRVSTGPATPPETEAAEPAA